MSFEDNFEEEGPFDVTDYFGSRGYCIRGLAFPLGGDYLYFYSSLKKGSDIPFAFWTYGMVTPNLFKLSPNGVKKKDIPNILRAIDILGIEFDVTYMSEHIILPSGYSMRDVYSDEIVDRYESFYHGH